MLEKKVIVYLDTGAIMEQVLLVKDANDYLKQMADYLNKWTGEPGPAESTLVFTTPLRFYKGQNVVALEFLDAPPEADKLPMGFTRPR